MQQDEAYISAMEAFNEGDYEKAYHFMKQSTYLSPEKRESFLKSCLHTITEQYCYMIKEHIANGDYMMASGAKSTYLNRYGENPSIANIEIPELKDSNESEHTEVPFWDKWKWWIVGIGVFLLSLITVTLFIYNQESDDTLHEDISTEVALVEEQSDNLINPIFKTIERNRWLADHFFEGDTIGCYYKSIKLTLPYDARGNLSPAVEDAVVDFITREIKTFNTNLNDALADFITRNSEGKKLEGYKGDVPHITHYADFYEDIEITPIELSDHLIVMDITCNIGGRYFRSGWWSEGFTVPLVDNLYQELVFKGKNLIDTDFKNNILVLLNQYCDDSFKGTINDLPNTIYPSENYLVFKYDQGEVGCLADGQVEVNVPYSVINQYMNPTLWKLIEASENWQKY